MIEWTLKSGIYEDGQSQLIDTNQIKYLKSNTSRDRKANINSIDSGIHSNVNKSGYSNHSMDHVIIITWKSYSHPY